MIMIINLFIIFYLIFFMYYGDNEKHTKISGKAYLKHNNKFSTQVFKAVQIDPCMYSAFYIYIMYSHKYTTMFIINIIIIAELVENDTFSSFSALSPFGGSKGRAGIIYSLIYFGIFTKLCKYRRWRYFFKYVSCTNGKYACNDFWNGQVKLLHKKYIYNIK